MLIMYKSISKCAVYRRGLFMWFLRASTAHGWVSLESFLDGDVALRDYEAEQKGSSVLHRGNGRSPWKVWME